jgi:cytochrome b6-f complex iron-sulfur subunit
VKGIKVKIQKFTNIENVNCNRRGFIKDVFTGVGYVTIGSFAITYLNSCSDDSNPASPSGSGNNVDTEIKIDITLAENNDLQTVGGSIAIESNDIDASGMLVIRSGENSVAAFSRTCTHQGCTLPNFLNGLARCPCHGSRFDTAGNVENGPATQPLRSYNAVIEDNIITITR